MTNQELRVKREEEELAKMLEERNKAPEQEEEEVVPKPSDPQEPKEESPKEESKEEDGEEDTGWKKRYGDLRKHSQKTEEKFKSEIEALKKRLDEKEAEEFVSSLPSSEAELEEWRKEHPHAHALVETLIERRTEEKLKKYKSEIEKLKNSVMEDRTEVQKSKAEITIKKAHPDFDDLQEDDKFHEWVEKQIKSVQDAVYESTNPTDVIWAIDMYKLTTSSKKKNTPDMKDAAKAVTTNRKPAPDTNSEKGTFKESEIHAMSEQEYVDKSDEIEKARRAGKIIYDLSGAAR